MEIGGVARNNDLGHDLLNFDLGLLYDVRKTMKLQHFHLKRPFIALLFVSVVVTALAISCLSCSMNRHYKDVSADEFMQHYQYPTPPEGYSGFKYIFRGQKKGCYLMDYYDMGTGVSLGYRYTIRVPVSEIPSELPEVQNGGAIE